MTAVWLGLSEALGGVPDFGGAAVARCVGKHELFDIEDEADERAEAARYTCQSCPALAACSAWFDSLPRSRRVSGTVAGVTRAHRDAAPPRVDGDLPERKNCTIAKKKSMTLTSSPRIDAPAWLANQLADGRAVLKSELLAAALGAGMSESTLSRAGRRLGVVSEPLPGKRGPAVWSLPDADAPRARPGSSQTNENDKGVVA